MTRANLLQERGGALLLALSLFFVASNAAVVLFLPALKLDPATLILSSRSHHLHRAFVTSHIKSALTSRESTGLQKR